MTQKEILERVAKGEIKPDEAAALMAAAQAATVKVTYKVSEKGALSAYGMGRWPVTLYREQWERLDMDDERERRRAFIQANATDLKTKGS